MTADLTEEWIKDGSGMTFSEWFEKREQSPPVEPQPPPQKKPKELSTQELAKLLTMPGATYEGFKP